MTVRSGQTTTVHAMPWEPDRISWADAKRLLGDLGRWDGASFKERREAAERVAERTDGFSLKGLETFSAGGQTHEVAIFTHARTGMEFTLVPGGTFLMGSPETEEGGRGDEKQHRVTMTGPFLIARTEVTQAVWKKVMGTGPSDIKGADYPVERVSWEDVSGFCKRVGLVLPSEAQWEYACRAGTTSRYATGDSEADLGRAAWYRRNAGVATHPVRGKAPNAFGLYDMHGNVWEWCSDWYAFYAAGHATDPTGPSQARTYRVFRGGSFILPAKGARSAFRFASTPGFRFRDLGFRPAKSVKID